MSRLLEKRRPDRPLVEAVKTYARSEHTPIKFEGITTRERQEIAMKAADVGTFRDQRVQWEAPPASPARAVAPTATRTEPASKGSRPITKPTREVRPLAVVPPTPVRVSQPERVAVPSTPRTPKPGESRFIPKLPPSHPAQEHTQETPAPSPEPSSPKSRIRPDSTESPKAKADRQR
jgi:hypothetical protein